MIDFTPSPIAFSIGSLDIRWYGIAYVVAILAGAWLRCAKRAIAASGPT